MDRPRSHPERVANNFWFVFFAYFLAIAAWSAVAGNDFISSRWRTVSETRRRGRKHLFIVFLPMSYMVIYVYYQAKSGDYKELCAALVAYGFAILHMVRTVLGLWQLHIFKQWAVRSICCMESLGYRIELSSTEKGRTMHRGKSSTFMAQEKRLDRAHRDADSIKVNDTIVDNRLSEGDVQCYFQFFTPQQATDISRADSVWQKILLTIFYATKSTVCFVGIVWPLLFSRSPLYSKSSSSPFIQPREPEELWLRWATVLISCAFPNWVTDMRKTCSSETQNHKSEFQAYRDRFAEEIVLSAALHCERDTSHTSCSSFLPFHNWHNFPKLRGGTFCKQELLRYACTTGNGLPFQAPHKLAASMIGGDLVYSYATYHSKLERARDALPANEGEKLRFLGTEELEWLSIFLSVEDWSNGTCEEDDGEENPEKFDISDIAIENLWSQLGFQENLKSFSGRLAAPFLKGKRKVALWGNRNASALSAHVDNWLALLAGEQVSYMVQQVPSMKGGFLFKSMKSKDYTEQTQDQIEVGVQEACIRLEKQRLMFQFSVIDPEFSYFDQTLTFLGCSMENLRSSLAKWVERNSREQASSWAPKLDCSQASSGVTNGREFQFLASKDFESCLAEVSSVSCWSQRYLRMRILWELQDNLHRGLPSGELSPNQTEAMLLCMLSFPAICVDAVETEEATAVFDGDKEKGNSCCISMEGSSDMNFRIENCKLTITAAFRPQEVHIEVFFARPSNFSGIAVTAKVCSDENLFVWEAWRDAFYGSLEGTRQWQHEHQITKSPIPVRPYLQSIGEGICDIDTLKSGVGTRMSVWKGWPPPRETLAKYEIMTEGLILQRKKTGVVPATACVAQKKRSALIDCPRVEYVPVSYRAATGHDLTHASLVAHEFLRRASGCSHAKLEGWQFTTTCDEKAEGHRDLQLLFYEISATKNDDDVALGKALNILISGNPKRQAIERAVELLERYFTSEVTKAPSARIIASLYKPFQNKNWVQKVKAHYETLMVGTSFDAMAAISYAGFCTAVSSYRKEVLNEDGIRALGIAIVRTNYSGNVLQKFDLTKSLEMLIATDNEERFSLGCAMYSNKIEHAAKILSGARNSVDLRRRCTPFIGIFGDPSGEANFCVHPEFASEVKKRKADAQLRLGQLLKLGTGGIGGNASLAIELYNQAIEDGNMTAAYNLGLLLEDGIDGDNGIPADPSRAMVLYTRAMNAGIGAAVSELARLYNVGKGVPRNPAYAVELYTRAIEESGSIFSMYNLALLLEDGAEGVPADPKRAFELYSRAVEEGGDTDSMHNLALLLQNGAQGVPKDVPNAVRLFERAIKEGGHPRSKCSLAYLLVAGEEGVPVNIKRAISLYKRAIDEGDSSNAMFNLGLLYLKGTGVLEDALRAVHLFQRGIEQDGNVDAMICLGGVLKRGAIGVPPDPVRAVELYTRAIEEHGSGGAMYRLGRLLESGAEGLPSDLDRALSLYKRAVSETNHERSAERLQKIEEQKKHLEEARHRWK